MLKFKKKPGNGFQILPSQIELHTRHLGEYPSTPVRDIVRVLGIVQPVKRKSSGPLVTVSRGRGVLRYSVVGLCDFWGPIHSNAAAVPSPRIANIKAEWELGFAVNLNRCTGLRPTTEPKFPRRSQPPPPGGGHTHN